jgi:perosamine synthetase
MKKKFKLNWSARSHNFLKQEKKAVLDVMTHADPLTQGKYLAKFENDFKKYLKSKGEAFGVTSGASAIELAAACLDLKPNDEIIIPAHTYCATALPFTRYKAKIIWADIDLDTMSISCEQIRKLISKKTKAIIAVHLYGNLCNMSELLEISTKYGIPLIEDSAEAIGSTYNGQKAGSIGKFGTFSFHGTKTITTGEGGMFVTNDSNLYKHVLTLSNHGRSVDQTKQFWPDMVGFKYKMSNIQAAIGCGQVERIDELTAKKKKILKTYKHAFSEYEGVKLNPEPKNVSNGAWMPTIYFDKKLGITSENLQKEFHKNNIDARVFFWPLSSLPFFKDANQPNNIFSNEIPKTSINLPSYHDMTEEEMERVINVCKCAYNKTT